MNSQLRKAISVAKTSPMHTLVGSEVDETFWENYNILKPESRRFAE